MMHNVYYYNASLCDVYFLVDLFSCNVYFFFCCNLVRCLLFLSKSFEKMVDLDFANFEDKDVLLRN